MPLLNIDVSAKHRLKSSFETNGTPYLQGSSGGEKVWVPRLTYSFADDPYLKRECAHVHCADHEVLTIFVHAQ